MSPDLLAWAGDTPSAATGRSPAYNATPSHGHDGSQRLAMTAMSTIASRDRRADEGSTLVMSALPDIPSSPTALADIDTSSTATPVGGEFEVPAAPAPSPSKNPQEEGQRSLIRTSPPGSLSGLAIDAAAPVEVLADDVMPAPPPSRMQMWSATDREAAMPDLPALADDKPHHSAAPMAGWSSESPESRPSVQSQLSRPPLQSQHAPPVLQAGPDAVQSLEALANHATAQEQKAEKKEEQQEEETEDSEIDDLEELELP